MFDIPDFYKRDMSLDQAVNVMKGNGSTVLDMMENLDDKWALHCSGHHFFDSDDEFFQVWEYEVNAYNVIKEHGIALI